MAKTKDVLLDHNYDGIKELDNDLPPWWLWLFYLSIIWSAIYLVHYHVLKTGKSAAAKYQQEVNPNYQAPVFESHSGGFLSRYHSPYHQPNGDVTPRVKRQFDRYIGPDIGFAELVQEAMRKADAAELAKLQNAFPEMFANLESHGGPVTPVEAGPVAGAEETVPEYEALTDVASLAAGKEIYEASCATCHGQNGEGGIGPNITDDYWIHGAGVANMMHIVKVGVPAKGMISWRSIFDEDEMLQVVSYMATLYGTNPPKGKKPQGEQVDMTQYIN